MKFLTTEVQTENELWAAYLTITRALDAQRDDITRRLDFVHAEYESLLRSFRESREKI
jgi:hypothetical protein